MSDNHASNWVGDKCLICGSKADVYSTDDCNHKFVECECCGRFELNTFGQYSTAPKNMDKLASYLYYNGKIAQPIITAPGYFYNAICKKNRFDAQHEDHPYCFHVTNDIVENWYPKSFSEKVDMFLLGLENKANFLGELILFTPEQLNSACFVIRNPDGPMKTMKPIERQRSYFIDYLKSKDYISTESSGIIILPNGMNRIDELQKNIDINSKTAFIAMSFSPEMYSVRDAIKFAIEQAGYIPRIMDEIEHNHQIVPEMLHEIRQARFVVAELTNHNNGAYFEAGYALGHGKEVIQLCKKSTFGADGHFDVKQINTIMWESEAELTEALLNRIKATVGSENK